MSNGENVKELLKHRESHIFTTPTASTVPSLKSTTYHQDAGFGGTRIDSFLE